MDDKKISDITENRQSDNLDCYVIVVLILRITLTIYKLKIGDIKMKSLNQARGIKMLQLVWNIFLVASDNFFAEPFSFRDLRFRCFFDNSKGAEKSVIYFHLSEEEKKGFIYLLPPPKQIYLYGAFNEINVCQVRSFGNIREMDAKEKKRFIQLIKNRMKGADIGDKLAIKPSSMHKRIALLKMQKGTFYYFEPLDYAYNSYSRG